MLMVTGFDLTTGDLYFTTLVEVFTNHILAENTYIRNHIQWTKHKIMVLKHANKYQIIWQCHNFKNILIDGFQHHPLRTNCKDKMFNIQIFIYYLIYSGTRKVFHKIM